MLHSTKEAQLIEETITNQEEEGEIEQEDMDESQKSSDSISNEEILNKEEIKTEESKAIKQLERLKKLRGRPSNKDRKFGDYAKKYPFDE